MKNEEASEVENEIQNSNAKKIYERISYLIDVYKIQEINFINLQKLLTAFNTPEAILPIWDIEKRNELDSAILELIRLLHNYLASVSMLIDHTRILITENYSQTEFIKEYQEKIDYSFKEDPLSCFMIRLRNYILHFCLPATFSKIEMYLDPVTKKQMMRSRVLIFKKDLLFWPDWTEQAKKYLNDSPEEIDLLIIINQYHDKTMEFNRWLIERLKAIHSVELVWLQEKSKQVKEFWDEKGSK